MSEIGFGLNWPIDLTFLTFVASRLIKTIWLVLRSDFDVKENYNLKYNAKENFFLNATEDTMRLILKNK